LGESKLNIMDGMDAARYNSANTHEDEERESTQMPMVLRNLNNKSNLDFTSSLQQAHIQTTQPPLEK